MEVFFNMYKVKYTKLLELLKSNEDINIGSNDSVNIFINLETILLKMCNPETNQYITVTKNSKLEFISNVINLAAHYRLFFTRHNLESKIFLCIPSYDVLNYKNSSYNKEYRMYSRFKFSETGGNLALYKMLKETIPFLKLITEYIQGVYLVDSNRTENSLIPYIIREEFTDDKSHNFIISGDLYDIQYVNFDYHMIIPKGDSSFICTKNNTIQYLRDSYECKGLINLIVPI